MDLLMRKHVMRHSKLFYNKPKRISEAMKDYKPLEDNNHEI